MAAKWKTLLIVIVLLVLGAGAYFGLQYFGILFPSSIEFTEDIPKSRPGRLDQAMLDRFSGRSMGEILDTLATENPPPATSSDPQDQLLALLPDAPFPFPGAVDPEKADALKTYITGFQKNPGEEVTEEDRRRVNLALAALHYDTSQIPGTVKIDLPAEPESDTFPISLASRSIQAQELDAVGNFDSDPEWEVITKGGAITLEIAGDEIRENAWQFPVKHHGVDVLPADFDDNSDLDLFVVRGNGLPNSLLKNEGDGKFTDITIEAGLLSFNDTTCGAWLDYDLDGRLDLLVGSNDHPLELYWQTEGGAFQPVAWDLKLWAHKGVAGIEILDINQDGHTDLFLSLQGQSDRLCLNQPSEVRDGWRFPNIISTTGLTVSSREPGKVAPLDFDGDGFVDIFLWEKGQVATLYRNRRNNSFEDAGALVGLPVLRNVTSIATFDLDSDGYDEIFVGTSPLFINRVFWNRGGIEFKEISISSHGSYLDAPVRIQTGDFDADGHVDLVYESSAGDLRRLESEGPSGDFIRLAISRFVPGLRTEIEVRDKDWILQTVSREFHVNPTMTVGIGNADVVETAKFFLPGQSEPVQTLQKLAPGETVSVTLPKRPKKRAVVPLDQPDES